MTINDLGGVIVLVMAGVGTFGSTILILTRIYEIRDRKFLAKILED